MKKQYIDLTIYKIKPEDLKLKFDGKKIDFENPEFVNFDIKGRLSLERMVDLLQFIGKEL